MSEENKRTTRRVLEELFGKGNLDATDELVHPDFVNLKQIHVWRLEDGRMIEHWSVRDDLGQALQLGLLD